jgi:hypothetical protein
MPEKAIIAAAKDGCTIDTPKIRTPPRPPAYRSKRGTKQYCRGGYNSFMDMGSQLTGLRMAAAWLVAETNAQITTVRFILIDSPRLWQPDRPENEYLPNRPQRQVISLNGSNVARIR